MSTSGKLAFIALGYVLAIAGGIAAVAVHELLVPADVAQASGGMVAFGDMILFVLVAGGFGLAPTWFLLKLAAEKSPRALLTALLVLAAIGPLSWLAVAYPTEASLSALPETVREVLGLLIAFGAIPRIVAGPVLLVVEAAAFFRAHERLTRALLVLAMLMDVVPLGIFSLHLASAMVR